MAITGCGAVSAAGQGADALWNAVCAGRGLVRPLTDPAFERLAVRHAATLPAELDAAMEIRGSRPASVMLLAAREAVAQAGWDADTLADPETAVCAATSKGDPNRAIALNGQRLDGALGDDANLFSTTWASGPGDLLRQRLGLGGAHHCPVAACATGSHALIRAVRLLRDGDARRVLVVAGDSSVSPFILGCFNRMGVLAHDCCRPFDAGRSGFVLAEGGAALTLELSETAAGRALATIEAWVQGADPSGITAQDETGAFLSRAMSILLDRAGWTPADVDLYCAHGTGTESNDRTEASAIRQVFDGAEQGGRGQGGPLVMAAKGVVGHLLGAAGLIEAIAALSAMRAGVVPPLPNHVQLDEACRGIRIADTPSPARLSRTVCTSLGFGGQFGLVALRGTE